MRELLNNLMRHKEWADATLLGAIRRHDAAAKDAELHRLLHHTILANRFWLALISARPFALEEESRIPESLDAIVARYRDTSTQELKWSARLDEAELARKLQSSLIPGGGGCSVAEGLMQVCMHSQGHRSQCATRLRMLGGEPPILDFILWLQERPRAEWS
jgi:uncharacterized damage-inducible protein DinB